MEGFTIIKEVKDYEILASYYDELLGNEEGYQVWLPYIQKINGKSILEVASGSGVFAKILQKEGYDITASDISEKMKSAARKNGFVGEYLTLDMRYFDLNKKFDLILCICDSFNYLEEEEIEYFFTCARKHLNPNGKLLFDMHHHKRLNEFENEYIEEGSLQDGTQYQWTILSDKKNMTVHENFVFYTMDGLLKESHQQKIYSPEFISTIAKKYDIDIEWIIDFVNDEKILGIGGLL